MKRSRFLASLPTFLRLPDRDDIVGWRILREYGAVFVAQGGAKPPPVVAFADRGAVEEWQASVPVARATIGGIRVELQRPAMDALLAARREARAAGLDITPRGRDAAKRDYAHTVRLWRSRVNPGLAHWVKLGKLSEEEAGRIRALPPRDQVPKILRLEERRLYFSKDFSKSILRSVAAPGTSQHISMLAFDVKEHDNATVRAILARHGWFQTVLSDLPHFTFLGAREEELPLLGLKKVARDGRAFWIPDLHLAPP